MNPAVLVQKKELYDDDFEVALKYSAGEEIKLCQVVEIPSSAQPYLIMCIVIRPPENDDEKLELINTPAAIKISKKRNEYIYINKYLKKDKKFCKKYGILL